MYIGCKPLKSIVMRDCASRASVEHAPLSEVCICMFGGGGGEGRARDSFILRELDQLGLSGL